MVVSFRMLSYPFSLVKKQPPEVFCQKRCSWRFHKIHRETPVPESLFNKAAGLQVFLEVFQVFSGLETLAQVLFSVNFEKFFKNTFFTEHLTMTASVSCVTSTCVRLSVEASQQWCSRVRPTRVISLDAKVVANALYSTNFCNV